MAQAATCAEITPTGSSPGDCQSSQTRASAPETVSYDVTPRRNSSPGWHLNRATKQLPIPVRVPAAPDLSLCATWASSPSQRRHTSSRPLTRVSELRPATAMLGRAEQDRHRPCARCTSESDWRFQAIADADRLRLTQSVEGTETSSAAGFVASAACAVLLALAGEGEVDFAHHQHSLEDNGSTVVRAQLSAVLLAVHKFD